MNSKIDKELSDTMVKALRNMKEMGRKQQENRDKKVWSNISVPLSLIDGLSSLTKDELNTIRQRLEIKNASTLKKAELIVLLQERIPKMIETISFQLDKDRYNLLRKLVRQNGFMEVPNLEANQIEYFRESGLIFTGTHEGKKGVVMPQEVVERYLLLEDINKITSIISRNTEWIKLTHGLLYYYGTLELSELVDLLEKYTKETVEVSQYLPVIKDAISYYKEICIDKYGFSNIRVFDSEKVKQEHQMRVGLRFFPFSKEQLLKAGEPKFVDRNDSYRQLVTFIIQNYDISKEEADIIVEECVYATRIGHGPSDVLKYIQSRLEFDSIDTLQAFMDRVVHLMNNTREWFLKGYTSTELSAQNKKSLRPLPSNDSQIIDIHTKQKIGRNDPCPCGSNKKFKKCCGR